MIPKRIQRQRTKGWRMPPNTISVTRPGKHGNPFAVGGYYMRGDPSGATGNLPRMRYTRTVKKLADSRYTLIETAAQAVEWYEWYRSVSPLSAVEIDELRGKNLACWCRVGLPCHGDVLLRMANKRPMPQTEEEAEEAKLRR